jgi:Putative prokaryotic signal transducing protein/zinc-ribbon domain
MDGEPLRCPSCAREHPPSERFCERCGMPLVHPANAEEPAVSERRQTARKIKPEYAEGKLVKVARGGSQPEAEFIAGLLLEEGIPSMLRRSVGSDVPDFMAAGPRDVMVPESGAEAAREALAWDP